MREVKLERCHPDDPKRCQGSSVSLGQCPFKALENSRFCLRHNGAVDIRTETAKQVRMYKLAQWQDRVNDFADHEQIKHLNEEIGILRITLEQLVVQSDSPVKFAINSSKISDLVIKIQKLVQSMHRMQISTGELIDRNRAIQIGQGIVTIISNFIVDPEVIDKVAEEIITLVMGSAIENK